MLQEATVIKNTLDMDELKKRAAELGEQAGKGKDTQIKFLLTCLDGGYQGVIDLVSNKHGQDRDDATILAEAYVKAQTTSVIFDAKAPNQRKLISCLRTSIKLGQWPKGGAGEPMATVNSLLNHRQSVRKVTPKLVDDAANVFLKFARAQLRRDTLITGDELKSFALKKQPDLPQLEDVMMSARDAVKRIVDGKAASGTIIDNSPKMKAALQCLNDRLAEIAAAKKSQKVTP